MGRVGDVERITTTERPLRDVVAAAINSADGGPANADDWSRQAADAVLPIIEQAKADAYAAGAKALAAERVRVVATQYDERVPENLREWADEMIECFQEEHGIQIARLAEFCHSLVLGAYCDGTKALDLANHPGPDAETDEWMNTPLGRQEAAREDTT